MKQTTKNWLLGLGLGTGLAAVVALDLTLPRKIQPIGWGDVNGDGVADALVLQDRESPLLLADLCYIDGNKIERDEHGDYRFKKWTWKPLAIHLFDIPPFRMGEGVYRSALVQRLGDRPGDAINLEVFTTVDVEPLADCQVYTAVKYQ